MMSLRMARAPADFHVADLRTAFEADGVKLLPNDFPTLITRFRRRGIVEQVGHGRYRVNREHPELVG